MMIQALAKPLRTSALLLPLLGLMALMLGVGPASAQSADSKLGVGDVLRITVYGQDDLDTVARISKEGRITFPLLGEVTVAGLTNRQAEARIQALLIQGKFVRNPQVSIFVEERVRKENEVATIIGQVNNPGRFAVDELSNDGAQSIAGVIALAGGIAEDAADYLILAKQNGDQVKKLRVDLAALLRNGDLSQNYTVEGGDIVLVPAMDVFYVYGAVDKPGRYRLQPGTTVMQAISVSGGLTDRGTEKGVSISRRKDGGKIGKVKAGLNDELQANDVVVVGERLF